MKTKTYPNGKEGEYVCACADCGEHFIGDHRDTVCPDCVVPQERVAEDPRDSLRPTEPHPAAEIAREYLVKHLKDDAVLREALASCAIEGNRMAEVCLGTLKRISALEPVSDRYLMGLAWFTYSLNKEKDKCSTGSKRKTSRKK
jgi:hypothetical protein